MPKTDKKKTSKYKPWKKANHRGKRQRKMIKERNWRANFPELFYFNPEQIPYWKRKKNE